jgi:hypothetical protein
MEIDIILIESTQYTPKTGSKWRIKKLEHFLGRPLRSKSSSSAIFHYVSFTPLPLHLPPGPSLTAENIELMDPSFYEA